MSAFLRKVEAGGFERHIVPEEAGGPSFARAEAKIAQWLEACSRAVLVHVRVERLADLPRLFGRRVAEAAAGLVLERLQTAFGESRTFRTGDRDFVVLSDTPSAVGMLNEYMRDVYSAEGQVLDMPAWIGYAEIPGDGRRLDVLSRRAELAMHAARDRCERRAVAFEEAFETAALEQHAMDADLRSAVPLCEFELHYQPQYDIRSASITGFEALLRWRSPKRGVVSPGAFIPALEHMGLISTVGEWAIRQGCAEAAGWPSDLSVAVNVSAAQLSSPSLLPTVLSALAQTNLSPGRLELEVTETCLIADADCALATLRQLRECGVKLSLDDFGTGYSSLSYLRRFPFHKIKIDQSFIHEARAEDALLKAIVDIGRALAMTTIAEGVETVEQLAIVAGSGCPAAQGYLISRPLQSDRVPVFLADEGARAFLQQSGRGRNGRVEAIASP